MPNKRVSALTASSALNGTELFYADNGVDPYGVRVTATQLKTFASSNSYFTFADAATLQAATVAADVQRIVLQTYDGTHGLGEHRRVRVASEPAYGGLRSTDRYLPDGTTDATNGGWWGIDQVFASPYCFGAAGDGVTDDTTAVQTCMNWAQLGNVFLIPSNTTFRCTDQIDCLSTTGVNFSIIGQDWNTSKIMADFTGCDKSLLRFRDDSRNKMFGNVSLFRFRLGVSTQYLDAPGPVLLDMDGPAQAKIEEIRFERTNNTVARFNSPNNSIFRSFMNFGGGRAWLRKRVGAGGSSATGVTVTYTGTTITSPTSIFDASDVGRRVFINDNTAGGVWATISAQAGTTATTVETAPTSFSGVISFGHARCSMTAGSNVVTAESSVFTADDNGCYVYIRNVGSNSDPIYGYLQYVNGTTCNLYETQPGGGAIAVNAVTNSPVGGAEFTCAAFDFCSAPVRLSDGSSRLVTSKDVIIDRLHTEDSWGVQVAVNIGTQMYFSNCKFHADDPGADKAGTGHYLGQTHAHLWIMSGVQGAFTNSEFENNCTGDCQFYGERVNGSFIIDNVHWNGSYNEVLGKCTIPATGSLDVGRILLGNINYTELNGSDPINYGSFAGNNPEGFIFCGHAIETRGSAPKDNILLSRAVLWHKTDTERLRMYESADLTSYWTMYLSASAINIARSGVDRLGIIDAAAGHTTLQALGTGADIGLTLAPKGAGSIAVSGAKIQNCADPGTSTDVATKNYCDTTFEKLGQYFGVSAQSSSYTLALAQLGYMQRCTSASAMNVTIPLNATVAFPIGTKFDFAQSGAGQLTFVPTGGVTMNSAGSATKSRVQYSTMSLVKVGTDTWLLSGDITP